MADRKRGLGRGLTELGLGELLSNSSSTAGVATALAEKSNASHTIEQPTLSVTALFPCADQPRAEIDPQLLEELAESIRTEGIIQPIIVRPAKQAEGDAQYEIVAGERRWRAAQLAGLTKVPVIVRALNDKHAMTVALIENIQREDLNPMEIAVALGRLTKEYTDMTHEDIAKWVGKSRSAVTNFLRLLSLEEPVKRMLENGDLEMGHARALLSLKKVLQIQTAKIIVDKALSVRAAEILVRQQQNLQGVQAPPVHTKAMLDASLVAYQKQLAKQLNTFVKIKPRAGSSEAGQLIIKYRDRAKLDAILKSFGIVEF